VKTNAAKTTSRNRTRKAAYLGQASKASRNDIGLDPNKPLIGELVEVFDLDADGNQKMRARKLLVHPGEEVAHDDRGNAFVRQSTSSTPVVTVTATQSVEAKPEVAMTVDPRARLAVLDARLGKGVGAVREREKLSKLIGGAQ
jgi:hypothetical protein